MCACVCLCYASVDMLVSACKRDSVSVCVCLPVREPMSRSVCTQWARGLWVWTWTRRLQFCLHRTCLRKLRQLFMFAQACEPFLIHPAAAFFDSADTVFITVFIHVSYGIDWITASSVIFHSPSAEAWSSGSVLNMTKKFSVYNIIVPRSVVSLSLDTNTIPSIPVTNDPSCP